MSEDTILSRPPLLLAYRVEVRDWPSSTGIYAAQSAAKAKYASWRAFTDAGYVAPLAKFAGTLTVRRAPEYDSVMANEKPGRGYTLEHAECLRRKRREMQERQEARETQDTQGPLFLHNEHFETVRDDAGQLDTLEM